MNIEITKNIYEYKAIQIRFIIFDILAMIHSQIYLSPAFLGINVI